MAKAQKELDIAIYKKAGIDKPRLQDLQLALCVELGELMNEWAGFKYWKKSHVVNRDRLLDEWADCMHFALSISNWLEIKINNPLIFNDLELCLKVADTSLIDKWYMSILRIGEKDAENKINSLILLGVSLNLSFEEMEQAYYKKRQVNFDRVKEGY